MGPFEILAFLSPSSGLRATQKADGRSGRRRTVTERRKRDEGRLAFLRTDPACRTTRLLPLSFYGGARKNVGWMGAKLHFSRRMEKPDGNMTDPRHEEFWLVRVRLDKTSLVKAFVKGHSRKVSAATISGVLSQALLKKSIDFFPTQRGSVLQGAC